MLDLQRFSRNILLNEIDFKGQEAICGASVLVVGCGGLASFVLPLLVASGVKVLTVVDFDVVDVSNLPRQVVFKNSDVGRLKVDAMRDFLVERAVNTVVKVVDGRHDVVKSLMEQHDVLLDLTDSFVSRLFCNEVAIECKKPFFTGAAQGFMGHVYSFAGYERDKPCYECLFGHEIKEEKTCSNAGVFSPIVEIVGGFIASNVLKYLACVDVDFTEFLFVDLMGDIRKIRINKDRECLKCNV